MPQPDPETEMNDSNRICPMCGKVMKTHTETQRNPDASLPLWPPVGGELRWPETEVKTHVCFDCEVTIDDNGDVMLPQDRESARSRELPDIITDESD